MARSARAAEPTSLRTASPRRSKRGGARNTLACDEYFELKGRAKGKSAFAPTRQNAIKGARENAEDRADADIAVKVARIANKWECDDECPEMVVTVTFTTTAKCRPAVDPGPPQENGFRARG